MMADIFTKATDKATFIKMRNAMMNVHGSLRGALERGYQLHTAACAGWLGRRTIGSRRSDWLHVHAHASRRER